MIVANIYNNIWYPRDPNIRYSFAILDLDGCLADNRNRLYLVPNKSENLTKEETDARWYQFHSKIPNDKMVKYVYDMYAYFCGKYPYARRIVLTGRPERYRHLTVDWLRSNNADIDEIYFRGNNDYRLNNVIKQDMVQNLMAQDLKPIFCFEDDLDSCRMFKALNIYTYRVIIPNKIIPYVDKIV